MWLTDFARFTSQELAEAARRLLAAGADAIAVPTDSEDTPSSLADLFAVTHAVDAPVLMRDWILHPLQIVDAKEAGAAGVLGVITSVMGDGTGAAQHPASSAPLQQSHLPCPHVYSKLTLVLLTLQPS